MNQATAPTAAVVEKHVPGFARIELDLLRCAAGTILRYQGLHETTVVILVDGFEVTSDGFPVQRWGHTDTVGRQHAATQAAQFVANRIDTCLSLA